MIALTTTSIAWLLFTAILVGWIVYAVLNLRQSRDELGSEIELAANRKKFSDDEILEGDRLTRVSASVVVLLVVIVIGLPLYWILEPARLAGAQDAKEEIFEEWGSRLFAPTADGGFNCAGCHGGMSGSGGSAAYNLTDPATGGVTAVNWNAPALNTVFYRFNEEEVRFILVYGRPFSPMSPWGVEGGGPMNDQQIDTLLAYMHSIQIDRENCGPGEDDVKTCPSGHLPSEIQGDIDLLAKQAVDDGTYASYGEALYNPRPRQRRLQLCPLPYPGLELGRPRRRRPGCVRVEPHRRIHQRSLPERVRHDRLRLERVDARCQVRHRRARQWSHARIRVLVDR